MTRTQVDPEDVDRAAGQPARHGPGDRTPPPTRPEIAGLPTYRPGRSSLQAAHALPPEAVARLASNESPLPPVEDVREAIRTAAAGVNRYADHRASSLRSALADWLGVGAERVTVGCGSVGLLQQAFLAYVSPGDEVVYPWPSFEAYPLYTTLVGARARRPALVAHAFDLDAVAEAAGAGTKLVVLASPNNPTGTALRADAVAALLDRLPPTVLVVLDEAYREFVHPSLGDLIPELIHAHANLLVLRTFSKAFGLAGLRVGYAVGHPAVVAAIDTCLIPFAVSAVAQAAAIAAIGAMDEVRALVGGIVSERERVAAGLAALGCEPPPSQANFLYLPLGERTDAAFSALEARGVLTRPFAGEGIRVTIGARADNDRFLAAYGEVAEPLAAEG